MTFEPKTAILPKEQQALWPLLCQVPRGFVLYGGTALALRLGHRESMDFDFFTSIPFAPATLRSAIPFLAGARFGQTENNTVTAWVRPLPNEREVKLQFFGGLGFPVLERPDMTGTNRIVIASLRDLAGTKAKAIHERIDIKDYQDIDALLAAGMSLSEIAAAAVAIFPGHVDYNATISAITYFEDGVAKSFPEALKKRLRAAVKGAALIRAPKPSYPSIEASASAVGR